MVNCISLPSYWFLIASILMIAGSYSAPGKFQPPNHYQVRSNYRKPNPLATQRRNAHLFASRMNPNSPRGRLHRFRRRNSSSSSNWILPRLKIADYDMAESLLNLVDSLRENTAAVYSSIKILKQNGDVLDSHEKFGDHMLFHLTEWQRNVDLLPQFENLLSRNMNDLPNEASPTDQDLARQTEFIFKIVVDSLKQTLFEVNDIIRQMPSIRYIFGPMVYNIKKMIDDIHHGSQSGEFNDSVTERPFKLSSSLDFQAEEDPSNCFALDDLKQFC